MSETKEVSFFDKLFKKDELEHEEPKEKIGFFDRIIASTTLAAPAVGEEPMQEPVKLTLSGGRALNDPIVASGFPVTAHSQVKWFRAPAGGQLDELSHSGNSYQLSPTDIGARICAQWSSEDGMLQSNFAQIGPIMFEEAAVEVPEQQTVPVEPSPSGPSECEAIDQSTPSRPPPPPKAPPPAPVATDATLNTRLQMSLQELELRRSQLERSKTTLANLQAKHDALQVELDAGRIRETASATTIVQLQHDVEALRREKDALRDQVNMMGESSRLGEQAVVARLELSTAKEAMQQLEAKYHTATSDIAAKADEIQKLKSQLIELTADRNMFMSDLESFKLTMQTVADESAAATKREQAAKSESGVLEGEIKVLKVQIDQLNSELSTARSASQAIQSHLDDQEKDQQSKLGNLSKTCEQLQDQLRLTQEQLDLVRAERKTLRIELDSMQSALQATSAQMAKVQSDCEAAKSEATRREKEISEANFQTERLRSELDRTLAELTSTRREVDSMRYAVQQLHEAQRRAEDAEKARDELLAEKLALDSDTHNRESELAAAVKSRDEMTAERNFFKRKAESLSHDMEKLLKSSSNHSAAAVAAPVSTTSSNANLARRKSQLTDGVVVAAPAKPSANDAEVKRAQQAEQEALKALEFYRKALEEQFTRSKLESSRMATAAAYRSDSQLAAQNKHLTQLANQYMETIMDKDTQSDHLKKVIKVLGQRVQELESAMNGAAVAAEEEHDEM